MELKSGTELIDKERKRCEGRSLRMRFDLVESIY